MTSLHEKVRIVDAGRTHTGTVGRAFNSLLDAWRDETPAFKVEAVELRGLWADGNGHSDEAMTLCASLGITVSAG